jgi:hypothetical protein
MRGRRPGSPVADVELRRLGPERLRDLISDL